MAGAIDWKESTRWQLRPFYGAGNATPTDFSHTNMGKETTCQSIVGDTLDYGSNAASGAKVGATSQGVAGWTKYTGGYTTWEL